ncbi:spermidine synthase [Amphritea sp. HPY]|uniref:spermidine synthase n=1 Tax=Amphritea sp. HPY TaxID=3421652 RepID=UPI003D7D1B9C
MNGVEVFRCYDEFGPIQVFDEGPYRYLTFGEGGEQSRILVDTPAVPIYQYTQAMLMALLFQPAPGQVTLLGLGAGSLANALLDYSDSVTVTAVELRPQVLAVAQRWFQLSSSPRLTIHIRDACHYISQFSHQLEQQSTADNSLDDAPADLIFTDIYSDQGMQHEQLDPNFIFDCYTSLSDQGVLVLNLWDEGKGFHPLARERLTQQFGEQWIYCPVDSGNLIVFAFKGGVPEISQRRLIPLANKLGKQLNVPFKRLLNNLHSA